MAHIVTSKCLGCKFTDCVEVCPVACFYELDGQLVIHPEDCIDCTACVAECPVEAAEQTAAWLQRHMTAAMTDILNDAVPVVVETTTGQDWAGTPLPEEATV